MAPTALEIDAAAKVDLQYSGHQTVSSLKVGTTVMPGGVYGSSSSLAPVANQDDVHFAGTGTITVVPPPQFVITSVNYDPNHDRLTLKWNSTSGATYTIENAQQFVGNGSGTSWDNLTTGIPSGGTTTTKVIDAPSPGTYYRIRKE